MATKTIAVLFGMEDTFPWALMNEIRERSKGEVEGVAVEVGHVDDLMGVPYNLVVDRISHEVPFYRTWLKKAIASGCEVVNNPLWWSADDKFFDNLVAKAVGVAVPRTVVLPHKEHPPNTSAKSFRNLKWVEWPDVFSYIGFPMFMKPAYGGGWKDVYKVDTPEEFFAAYDQTHSLTMMAQEAIEFEDYYRCYVIGRERVHVMRYDPRRPHHERYVLDAPPTEPKLLARIIHDAKALCDALGYDLNTVEFAIRDGVPIAIDFMNPAPDADLNSVGEENFRWVVENLAEVLINKVMSPKPFEPVGSWPVRFGLAKK